VDRVKKQRGLYGVPSCRPSETWPPEVFNTVADLLAEVLVRDFRQKQNGMRIADRPTHNLTSIDDRVHRRLTFNADMKA
jgi:hypothetical protein